MLNSLWAILGLVTGILINTLADGWPLRRRHPENKRPFLPPTCPRCQYPYPLAAWTGLMRWRPCPQCQLPVRPRPWLVELGTALLFALLPTLLTSWPILLLHTVYIAVLILVLVIDLEHRLIFNQITYSVTLLALAASWLVPGVAANLPLALLGTAVAFLLFFLLHGLGRLLFGAGALGFGDVKLAMMLGAMLGFPTVLAALALGVLMGGLTSLVLLLSRRVEASTALPYGQYLALGGVIKLIWTVPIFASYLG